MKLPYRYVKFWYPDSLGVFLRIWHNSLNVLEEDLAIGLMWRLLFVPMFHDSSLVGRLVSFGFRLTRVLAGVLIAALLTVSLIILMIVWFLLPLLLIACIVIQAGHVLLPFLITLQVFGIALFIDKLIDSAHKKVWQIKDVRQIWEATKLKSTEVGWNELLRSEEVKNLLSSLEIHESSLPEVIPASTAEYYDKTLQMARLSEAKFITAVHFFVALISEINPTDTFFLKFGLEFSDFEQALRLFEHKRNKWRRVFIWDDDFSVKHLKGVNRGWLGSPTPLLDSVSTDLTQIASREILSDFVGRGGVVTEVVTILSQDHDRNVLLVGEAGSGKSALVNFLAKMIVTGDAPPALAIKRLVSIDFAKLLSGIESEGDLADKIKYLFAEVSYNQNIIIFVDEIHDLGLREAGIKFNLYSLMLPYLESNSFQFIASTEPSNYAKVIEKNANFARIFHKVELKSANSIETLEILKERSLELSRYKRINLTYKAAKIIVELSSKLIHDRVLPDSALMVLEEALPQAENGQITSEIIKKILQQKIQIPVVELDNNKKQELLNLEEIIHQKMIDQEEAVKKVADVLRRSATQLRETSRPIGSFLFVGPTGVGKTELAKILAEVFFKSSTSNHQSAFLRFDMSEYQTEEAVNRLIGTTQNPGELTEAIKNKPYCLLLLDEFEKANPNILTLFLQVLDDGRLTDANGKTTDFTNTIIIATSNAGSLVIAQDLAGNVELPEIQSQVKDELLKKLKPELVNRFDEIIIFKPLSKADLEKVVNRKLSELQKTLKEQGYLIQFPPQIVSNLVQNGYDPVLGARPLRRLIQDTIEARLSRLILENKLQKGVLFNCPEDLFLAAQTPV